MSINFIGPTVILNLPVFLGPPKYIDIVQGSGGSCWFLSSIASYLRPGRHLKQRQKDVMDLFKIVGVGLHTVRLGKYRYLVDQHGPPGYFSVNQKVLWPVLLEKAVMAMNCDRIATAEGYVLCSNMLTSSIDTKSALKGLSALIGGNGKQIFLHREDAFMFSTILTPKELLRIFKSGNHIIALTQGKHYLPVGSFKKQRVINHHAYAVIDVFKVGDVLHITLYNPWGREGIGGSSNGVSTIDWKLFHAIFCCIQFTC